MRPVNVGDRVIVKSRPYGAGAGDTFWEREHHGLVTRTFRSWVRVRLDDGGKRYVLPQDFPGSACRPEVPTRPGISVLEDYCWCGDLKARHATPCKEPVHTPPDGRKPVTEASGDRIIPEPSTEEVSPTLFEVPPAVCKVCGAPLADPGSRGPARAYCSTRCRVAAHRAKATVFARDDRL